MDLRPLSVGELLDQTFRLFRRAWRPLILLGLLSIVPVILYATLMPILFRGFRIFTPRTGTEVQFLLGFIKANRGLFLAQFAFYLLYILIVVLITPLIHGALTQVASGAILRQPVTVREALRATLRRYGALLGTSLLLFLLYVVALPVLAIGGLVIFAFVTIPGGYIAMAVFFIFYTPAILLEGAGGGVPAMKRSYALVKGRFWPLLGAGLLFTLMISVLGGIFGLLIGFLTPLLTSLKMGPFGGWLLTVIRSLPVIVTTPFMLLGVTLAYYETRTRKEGLDMTLSVDALESPSDAPR